MSDQPSNLPPVPPGHARFYHGGVPGDGGKRWFSPSYEYARGYAEKSAGGKLVFYLDLPESSPLLSKAFDDTGLELAWWRDRTVDTARELARA